MWNSWSWALCLALLIGLFISISARSVAATPGPLTWRHWIELSPELLRDLPTSNNIYQLLETTEGEVTSDRFTAAG